MAVTYTFYTCKGKKNEKLKKGISEETKGRMKYSCDGEKVCF